MTQSVVCDSAILPNSCHSVFRRFCALLLPVDGSSFKSRMPVTRPYAERFEPRARLQVIVVAAIKMTVGLAQRRFFSTRPQQSYFCSSCLCRSHVLVHAGNSSSVLRTPRRATPPAPQDPKTVPRSLPVALLPARNRFRCLLSFNEQRKGFPETAKLLKGRRELQQAHNALPRIHLVCRRSEADSMWAICLRTQNVFVRPP